MKIKSQYEKFPTDVDKDMIFAELFTGFGRPRKPTLIKDGLRPTETSVEDIKMCFSEDDIL